MPTKSKQVALVATLVAVAVVVRVGFAELALSSPEPFYGIVVKIGLTETLAFIIGLAFGPIAGFTGGASIIVISDLMIYPGPWTPFIASIIGLMFGVGGGILRRFANPTLGLRGYALSGVILTVASETLQNLWVALTYGEPLLAAMAFGVPTLITALLNNTILLIALGPRISTVIRNLR